MMKMRKYNIVHLLKRGLCNEVPCDIATGDDNGNCNACPFGKDAEHTLEELKALIKRMGVEVYYNVKE